MGETLNVIPSKFKCGYFDNDEKLSEELRAELPLKRIWALVLEEE